MQTASKKHFARRMQGHARVKSSSYNAQTTNKHLQVVDARHRNEGRRRSVLKYVTKPHKLRNDADPPPEIELLIQVAECL